MAADDKIAMDDGDERRRRRVICETMMAFAFLTTTR